MWDFSNLRTQREYLEPLFHRLLSSDAGCYDFDGLKTDFMADKVHADMPVHDPTWRGEENYIYRLCKLFHALMPRHKPDACHLGCAGHPYLAEFMEINRTYDVAGSDVREHEQRGLMLEATVPGCPCRWIFDRFRRTFLDDYFETARRRGWAVELGNILMMRRDPSVALGTCGPFLITICRGKDCRSPHRVNDFGRPGASKQLMYCPTGLEPVTFGSPCRNNCSQRIWGVGRLVIPPGLCPFG